MHDSRKFFFYGNQVFFLRVIYVDPSIYFFFAMRVKISNPPENYQGAPKNFFFAVSASTGINLQIHQRFSKSESGPAENAIFWYHLTWNAPAVKFGVSSIRVELSPRFIIFFHLSLHGRSLKRKKMHLSFTNTTFQVFNVELAP